MEFETKCQLIITEYGPNCTQPGEPYDGQIAKTADGDVCLTWVDYPDMIKKYVPQNLSNKAITDAKNFCRHWNWVNAWCIADIDNKRERKRCHVPNCGQLLFNNKLVHFCAIHMPIKLTL